MYFAIALLFAKRDLDSYIQENFCLSVFRSILVVVYSRILNVYKELNRSDTSVVFLYSSLISI